MKKAIALLDEAKGFEDEGKFDLALEQYERAIRLGVGNQAIAHQGSGRALARLGRFEEALDECRKALALNSDLQLAHSVLGYVYQQQSRYDLAEAELLEALRLQPDDCVVLANLASMYIALDRYREATDFYEKIVQHQPKDWEKRIQLAYLHLGQSNFRQAVEHLNKTLTANPTMLKIYPSYAAVFISAISHRFGQLNPVIRFGISIGFYFLAGLFPPLVSVPVGVFLSGIVLLAVVANLWFRTYRHRGKSFVLTTSLVLILYCLCYWGIVLIRQNWLSQGV